MFLILTKVFFIGIESFIAMKNFESRLKHKFNRNFFLVHGFLPKSNAFIVSLPEIFDSNLFLNINCRCPF